MGGRVAGDGKRNEIIDALKFFAIALVPLQHLLHLRSEFSHLPGARAAVWFMVSFDMPLFVFLAGYVLFGREGSNPVSFLQRKALALLVPYFAWVSVEMLIERVPVTQWHTTLGWAAIDPHRSYQMWFLWVLFALFVIFTIARLVSRADLWLAALGAAAAAALLLPTVKTAGLDKIVLLLPYLVLGYLCAKHRDRLRPYDVWIAVTGVCAFAAMSFALQLLVPGQMIVPDQTIVPAQLTVPVKLATAVTGIVSAWALYRLLPAWLISAQAWVGRRSLGIYAGQMVMLPVALVGVGWAGVALSELTTMLSSVLLARVLELTAFTRAVFLGQWPRRPKSPKRSSANVALAPPATEESPSAQVME
jgi:fucose 4-O-acetylase-like acetyltransferase